MKENEHGNGTGAIIYNVGLCLSEALLPMLGRVRRNVSILTHKRSFVMFEEGIKTT